MLKKNALRITSILSAALASTLLFAGLATAHVTVKPAASAPEAWETYTIKVPTEKDVPTVKVTLKVPELADFKQYQPVPGWKTTLDKSADGKVKTVTWEAEAGSGIEDGQFQQFTFVAQNPSAEGELAWDAYQYYSDGSVVEWTGDEGADKPHSLTKITSAPAGTAPADNGHGHSAASGSGGSGSGSAAGNQANTGGAANNAAADNGTNTTAAGGSSSAMQTVTLIITIIALIASLAALWFAVQNRRRKA